MAISFASKAMVPTRSISTRWALPDDLQLARGCRGRLTQSDIRGPRIAPRSRGVLESPTIRPDDSEGSNGVTTRQRFGNAPTTILGAPPCIQIDPPVSFDVAVNAGRAGPTAILELPEQFTVELRPTF